MAFFGLTALGAQNPFLTVMNDNAILNIFSVEEVKASFNKVDSEKKGAIYKSSIGKVLGILFHGPPPQTELARFNIFFDDIAEDGYISWKEFEECYHSK
jgi:Ca2+-binding EF-hand superfamily protein